MPWMPWSAPWGRAVHSRLTDLRVFIQKSPDHRTRHIRHQCAGMAIAAVYFLRLPSQLLERVLIAAEASDEVGLSGVRHVNVVEPWTLQFGQFSALRPVLQTSVVIHVSGYLVP